MSGPIRFTVVAGTDKKPLGLTKKDAHVSFFFTFCLHQFFVISPMYHFVFIRFSSANMLVNVIGIHELVRAPSPTVVPLFLSLSPFPSYLVGRGRL